MSVGTLFTRKEELLLSALLPPTTRHRTFADLIGRWNRIVDEVESGYRLGIYDYRNDLTIREIIARITEQMDERLQRKIATILAPLDERFIGASVIAPKPVFPGAFARHAEAWWYLRLPHKLEAELLEDAQREGLVAAKPTKTS